MKKTPHFSHKRLLIYFLLIGSISILTLSKLYSQTPSVITVSVGNEPRGGAFNPYTGTAVVSNHNTNTVSVFNITTFSVTNVTVGSHPYGVAINTTTNKAYIANEQSDTVSVIDLNTNSVTATITVGGNPRGIAVNSTTNQGIVANSKTDTVSILDLFANTVSATLPVGVDPEGVVINRASNLAYVTNFGSDNISIINLTTKTVVATLSVGSGPIGIDMNPNTQRIVVTNRLSNTVSVIDGYTNTVVSTIAVGTGPYGVAIHPVNNVAYVTNEYSDSVSVINLVTNAVTATYPVGKNPAGVAVTSQYNLLFVVNAKGDQVFVINLNNPPTGTAVAVGKDPEGVTIDPDTNTAITANSKSNNLSVIDITTSSVTGTIPVGQGPQDVALHPTSKRLVSANYRDNTATVIDYPTRTVLATVSVGKRPRSVAIDPVLNIAVVANEKDGTLSFIDLSANTVSATLPAGSHPVDIDINPQTHIAVVANKKIDSVTLIDLANKLTLATLSVGKDPNSVAINPNTNTAVVANQKSATLSVIDLGSKTVTATISTLPYPTGIAINPSTNIAAVTSHETNSLQLIDLNTNLVLTTLYPVGIEPEDAAINPYTNVAAITNESALGLTILQLPNPVPVLTSLSPVTVTAGDPGFTLTLNGSKFLKTSTVTFNTQSVFTQFVNNGQLTASIPASAITTAGSVTIAVTNPSPGGGTSNPLSLTINNPVPVLNTLSPTSVIAGSGSFQLTLTGTKFLINSTVYFNGVSFLPVFINSTTLNVTIPSNVVAAAGYDSVTVFNPAPGGGSSNSLIFTVNNPVPVLATLSPATVIPGSGDFLLTLTGTNFVSTTTISFDNQILTPGFISSTQINVTISGAKITTAHTATVTLFNPAPGGGISNILNLIVNTPPVANAGNNLTATVGKQITLDGRKSYDADPGDRITFSWSLVSKPAGSATSLMNMTSVRPNLTPDVAGNYQLQLIVNDGKANSLPATATITATAGNSPPNADAGSDQTALIGQTVTFDGRRSSDPDNDRITYQWRIISAPAGSTATLTGGNTVQPTLKPDLAGAYVLQLIANDGIANGLPVQVKLTAASTGAAPMAKAGRDKNALTGNSVTLDGTQSRDPNGNPLIYKWSFVSIPAGSTTSLGNATTATLTWTPDKSGEYLVRLVTNNGASDSAPDTLLIVANAPNAGPNAMAGADQLIYQTDTVTLDGSASSDPDGDPITYSWLMVSTPTGSKAAFSTTTAVKPTFLADLNGYYVARLTVNDGISSSFADVVVVKTKALVSIALSPVNPAITLGQTLAFTATGTFVDSTTKNLTNLVSWISSNATVATINSAGTATALQAGTTQITASYGAIVSPAQALSVNNPLPVLSSLTPSSAIAGSSSFTLTLFGSNFINSSTINFGSQPLNTTFVDASHLSASVPASAIASPGTVSVSVINPAPGGGTSNAILFNVIGPVINSISPASGSIGTVLTISGQNFDPLPSNNRVMVNNTPAIITSASTTQIKTLIPEGATTGPVFVTTPQGSATSPAPFTVTLSTDFSLTGAPSTVQTVQGSPAAFVVTSASIGSAGYTGFISLTVSGLPAGAAALLNPPQIHTGGQATLTVNTPSTLPIGSYPFTINGTAQIDGQTVSHQSTVALKVLAAGISTLYGQVLSSEGPPLQGVTVTLGASVSYTDAAGNFFLQNIPTGAQMVAIDGRTANTPGNFYPQVDVAVTIQPGASNPLGYPLYLPKLDIMHPINLPVDSTGTVTQTVQATTPLIPDLAVTIPAGTRIIDPNGNPVSQITITPVPVDKSPMPLPAGVNVPLLFTIQPGGSVPSNPIPICFPNTSGMLPGNKGTNYYFDLVSGTWKSWGTGTVTADGRQVCSDPGYGLPRFAWHFSSGGSSSGSGPSGSTGDPVDIATGQLLIDKTDLAISGLMPVSIKRQYQSGRTASGAFGIGAVNQYDWYLQGDSRSFLALITPDGRRAPFPKQPDGTFMNTSEPWLAGAKLTGYFSTGWTLVMKDGFTYKFNTNGNLISETDRYGNQMTLTRVGDSSSPGQITRITDSYGRSLVLTYDAANHVTQVTDPMGRMVNYTYDSGGHLITVTDPAGGITIYGYDSNGRISTITDPRGVLYLTTQYDANGRVIQQTQADGGIWKYAYTLNGSIVMQMTATNPQNQTGQHQLNPSGYKTGSTDPLGQTTRFEMSVGTNRLLSTTDPIERKTSYTYDANNNVTSNTDPAGFVTTYSYEPTYNKVTSITDPLGNITKFSYDTQGNLISTTDPSGAMTRMTYNAAGQPLTITDALGNVSQFVYDAMGNLNSTIDPLGNQTIKLYDLLSRLISATDPLNHTSTYNYDALNRVTQITDAIAGLTKFSYDPNGNLLTVMDAKGNTTSYSYDNMDRLATRTDPLLRQESYQYDSNGSLIKFTDRKGQITQYQYDSLNRKNQVTYADGSSTLFNYDSAGRITTVTDTNSGQIQYGYDNLNRLIQETTPQGVVNYGYDALGRRTSMAVNGQSAVTYAYDANSRLTTLMALSQVYSITYDPSGRRTALSYPNGVTTSYSYDADSRVNNIIHQAGISTIENIGYSYDQNGNRTAINRANGSATNLPQALQSAYDAANEMTNYNSTTTNLTYDANGNLTYDGTKTYTWNARNQLISMSGNVTASFSYDAVGRRISKTINGTRTDYQYDGNDIVSEIGGGAVRATYVRSLNIDEPYARITSAGVEYYHTDALGSVFALTDAYGNTTASYSYDPFGNTIQTGISSNPFQYTGRENDGTGLYYFRARYYFPALQRFISEDPIGLKGGINFYAYTNDNPINRFDPLGLDANDLTYGEIRSWAIKSLRDLSSPEGLADAKASIDAACGRGNPCNSVNGANATKPGDQAAWNNIVNATGGTDRSGGGNFMCVGSQNCWFVHKCYSCQCGKKVLMDRATNLLPSGTVSVSSARGGTLFFYKDDLQGWCTSQDRNSACK